MHSPNCFLDRASAAFTEVRGLGGKGGIYNRKEQKKITDF